MDPGMSFIYPRLRPQFGYGDSCKSLLGALAVLGVIGVIGKVLALHDGRFFLKSDTDEFVSGIATSWNSSEEGLKWVLQLRENVFTPDGHRVGSKDTVLSLGQTLNADLNSPRLRLIRFIGSRLSTHNGSFRMTRLTLFTVVADSSRVCFEYSQWQKDGPV